MDSNKTETPNFDEALKLAGGWGRWQLLNLIKCSTAIGCIGICVMVWTFAAFDASVRCAVPAGCEPDVSAASVVAPPLLASAVGDSCTVLELVDGDTDRLSCDAYMAEVKDSYYSFLNNGRFSLTWQQLKQL